jgi:two-component system, sensor histidine kinase YesM
MKEGIVVRFWERLNSKFFYKVFAVITLIILVSSLTISFAIYYRFYNTMSKQNGDFIKYTSNQVKSNIINLTKKCEWIAGNIYSDNNVETLLKENYYKGQDYSLFVMFNTISSSFHGLEDNNREISSISIYKLDPNLIINGREIKDVSKFKHYNLIERAIKAKGNNVWTAYRGDDGRYIFCLLKFLNIYSPGGVLVIELKEENLFNLYNAGTGDKNNLFIVDENQSVISSNIRENIGKRIDNLLKGYSLAGTTSKEVFYNNTPYFFYTDAINAEWRIVMIYDAYEIEKEKRHMKYYVLILTGVFILIGLLFSLFLASNFASQVDRLMAKIKEIERGNLHIKPDIKKVNEFHQLDKTLCAMAQNIENLNADVMKAVKQKEEIEIKFLQMQMNPHFLYNLLSIIRWTAYHNKQSQIMHIVDNLSNFYKIVLSKGNEVIDLGSELNLVKSYIELQNLCCNNTINLSISVDDRLAHMKISKMTLQPFVENSVVHGRIGGRELNININVLQENDDTVKILIEDDGLGITDEVSKYIESLNEKGLAIEGKHYGITNTITRLRLLYGGKVTIHAVGEEQGTLIELIINRNP